MWFPNIVKSEALLAIPGYGKESEVRNSMDV